MKNIIKIINFNLPKGFKLKIFRESNYNIVCNYYLVMYYKCDKSFFLLGKASILRKSSHKINLLTPAKTPLQDNTCYT